MKSFAFSIIAAAAHLGLAACNKPEASKTAAGASPPTPAAAAPNLWSIEVLDGDKVTSRVDICADAAVRAAFARPTPVFGGQSCERASEPYQSDAAYSVKCRGDGRLYRVGATKTGDEASEFIVDMSVKRQDQKGPVFQQSRRYRLLGACPAGWTIGDSAAPGAKEVVNTLTGQKRATTPAG